MTNNKKNLPNNISKWFVLAAMAGAFFIVCYNTTALINALPIIANQFHININDLQWVINGYVLTAVSFIALSGRLGDIFDKKKLFLLGALGYLICSIVIALSWNQFSLIGGRAAQGLFAAFIASSTLTIIKATFADKELVLALGIWSAVIGIGNAIGPFVGGFITTYFNWHYIFWANAVLMSFSIIVAKLAVKNFKKVEQKISIDYTGAILLSIGLFLLVLALVQGNIWGFISIKILMLLILGVVVLIILMKVESKKTWPIISFQFFYDKIFLFSSFGMFIAIACSIIVPYFLNFYLQNSYILGYSPVLAGAALLPFSFSILIASLFLPKINNRIELHYILPAALLLLAFALLGLGLSCLFVNYKSIVLFLILSGFGLGLVLPVFQKMALSCFTEQNIGQGSGLVNMTAYLGDLLAVTLGSIAFYFFGGLVVKSGTKGYFFQQFNEHFLVNAALLGDKTTQNYFFKTPGLNNIFAHLAQQ
ncbi:MAG: MFS transporter, partial [Gammaproteobacteria bacterium]|nr:MFS transporter [Gammaproteobacteria bacterium]